MSARYAAAGDALVDGLVDAEQAARLHEAERHWLAVSRARLRSAATGRRPGGSARREGAGR